MEIKKSKKADKTKKSALSFLIGLNVVLLLTLASLELVGNNRVYVKKEEPPIKLVADEEVIITERQFNEPPPPIEQPPPPEIPVEIEVVKDDIKLEKPKPKLDLNQPPLQQQQFSGPPGNPGPSGPPPNLPKKPDNTPKEPERVDKEVNARQAKFGMIYPGCEKFSGNNKELLQCFSEKFSSDVRNQLAPFEDDDVNKFGTVRVNFTIDKNGNVKIKDIDNPQGVDKALIDNGIQAFKSIQSNLERKGEKGKGITPAKDASGNPIPVTFEIKLVFQSSQG